MGAQTPQKPIERVLAQLRDVREVGEGYQACCPSHDDQNPSLSIREGDDGRVLLHCFAGCKVENIAHALNLEMTDLFADIQLPLTTGVLANAKRIPASFLQELGLSDSKYKGQTKVCIPYRDINGETIAVRNRHALSGDNRFTWRRGDRATLYGLERLRVAKAAGWVLIVEGESDCWTGWWHDLPVIGVPGKTVWRHEWASHFEGIDVYLWQEPDAEDFALRVSAQLPNLCVILAPQGIKDLSEAHLQGKDIASLLEQLRRIALPISEIQKAKDSALIADLATLAAPILVAPDPLELVGKEIRRLGYGGDLRSTLIVYLAMTSRLLAVRPGTMLAHLLLLGPAGAGKSYTVQVVRRLLPERAVVVIDAGSPRVLIYMDDELQHRVLIYSEADSLPAGEDNPAASAIRNLLQDNRLSYKVVRQEPSTGDHGVQEVTKEGPTVLVTTAVKSLGHQLGTRLFTLEVPDDPKQVRAALAAQGSLEVDGTHQIDERLIAFQDYLQLKAPWDVVVPFAPVLSETIGRTNSAPRILRDFQRLLALIKAVTVLRHTKRNRDAKSRLIATLEDYQTIRDLTNHMYVGSVSGASNLVRETVEAVEELLSSTGSMGTINAKQIADQLGIHASSAGRRIEKALENGWLINMEDRRGRPLSISLGDPLPATGGLPEPEELDLQEDLLDP